MTGQPDGGSNGLPCLLLRSPSSLISTVMSTSSPQMDPDDAVASPAAGGASTSASATGEAAGVEHGDDQVEPGPSTTAADKEPDSGAQASTAALAAPEDDHATTSHDTGAAAGAPAGEMAVNGSSGGRGELVENGTHEQQQGHSENDDDDGRSTGEHGDAQDEDGGHTDSGDRIAELEAELDRVSNEKDTLESQYRGLLGKLTNMRNTLGDKLRQDAVRPRTPHCSASPTGSLRKRERLTTWGDISTHLHRKSSTAASSRLWICRLRTRTSRRRSRRSRAS